MREQMEMEARMRAEQEVEWVARLADQQRCSSTCRALAPHMVLLHHLCCSLQLTLLNSILL
jgi:hypothetical protein